MKKVQLLKNGGMRYSNVRIENNPTDKFSDMVVITKTPSKLKSLLKQFTTSQKITFVIIFTIGALLINHAFNL